MKSNTDADFPRLPSEAFSPPELQSCLIEALDWLPELKHEGLVCTFLSAALRRGGAKSSREETVGTRRYDMKIEGQYLEAKYHAEGDLHATAYEMPRGGRHTVLLSQLHRFVPRSNDP